MIYANLNRGFHVSNGSAKGVNSASWISAGAEANRQLQTREKILGAAEQLKVPRKQWPVILQAFADSNRSKFRAPSQPAPFQAPAFDRLNQSAEEWVTTADAHWERHKDNFLRRFRAWQRLGVDGKIPQPKRHRGPASNPAQGRRNNSAIEKRYEWAALRICGDAWKEIAAKYGARESTVTKAATTILQEAGWSKNVKRIDQP